MKMLSRLWNTQRDGMIGATLGLLAFALYFRTLAPTVVFLFDDTLEFQYVIPRLGILHPTGYPLYTLVGKLFTLIVPLNDVAYRLNLFSALCAALAVTFVYLVAQQLTTHRIAAIIGATIFAVGDTFWAQAVVAEVYTLQMVFAAVILWLTLNYAKRITHHALLLLAFTAGLGLTHHRLIVLLFPAVALYVFFVNRNILRDRQTLIRVAFFFLLPLAIYLYLPLRGNIGSADGTYENSLTGFVSWVMASKYTAFLTQNPFQVQHDAEFFTTMFRDQFTLAGLVLAAIGLLWLLRKPKEWALLVIALIAELIFVFNYRTADVDVHLLTPFLLLAIFVAGGADAIIDFLKTRFAGVAPALGGLLLLIPLYLLVTNFEANDLSQHWQVYNYGIDVLSQPLEKNSTIIGITGEATLIRYLQEHRGMRPDVQTIAADTEDARAAAIDDAVKQNRAIYLTRPLKNIADKFSLGSVGPLIRVNPPAPTIANRLDENFGAVKLVGYDVQRLRDQHVEDGNTVRVTLYWQVVDTPSQSAWVSVKILRGDGRLFGQTDGAPVLTAYPTRAWRKGEIIADTHNVPVFLGTTPGEYNLTAEMYEVGTLKTIGQATLGKISLDAESIAPRREAQSTERAPDESLILLLTGHLPDAWNINRSVNADFGAIQLAGYSFGSETPIRPGDELNLTLLWRAGWQKPPDNLMLRFWLEDANGKQVVARDNFVSIGYPPFLWQPNIFVRDFPEIRLPANLSDGEYRARLAVSRNNELLGLSLLPFIPTIVDLGPLTIRNRERVTAAPKIPNPREATFDNKINLLGYETRIDTKNKSAQVTLYWKSLALMDTSYTVFVHVLDAKNNIVASGDSMPGEALLPTTGWIADEYIIDPHTLHEIPAGTYQIEIGWYDTTTGTRLKTGDGASQIILSSFTMP